jgi:uncharacterized protein (TIGR02996 family)
MDEDAFLRAILADPADAAARLVYADWLEERGDERSCAKAEFLRLEAKLKARGRGRREPKKRDIKARLRELRETLGRDWLAQIDRARVENCGVEFAFQCPKQWERLQATNEPRVRHCEACDHQVYHCATIQEARDHAARGHCIAVDSRLTRRPRDLTQSAAPRMRLGRAPPPRHMMPPAGTHRAPFDPSEQAPLAPGRRVTIREGVYAGLEGIVRAWLSERRSVLVDLAMFARFTAPIELERGQVEPID